MNVSSATHYLPINTPSSEKNTTSNMEKTAYSKENIADRVTISSTAQSSVTKRSDVAKSSETSATATFNTSQGYKKMSFDELFSPANSSAVYSIQTLPPLLLPSKDNIDALTKHISANMPQFLAENNIPSAPSSISYNQNGHIQLPSDYAYASEFMEGLENDPIMAKELSTVNALTSQYVEMQKLVPFHNEFASANSQAEMDAVIAKYNYLLSDNRQNSMITMSLSANGSLSLFADGKSVS